MAGKVLKIGQFVRLGSRAHHVTLWKMGDRLGIVTDDLGDWQYFRYTIRFLNNRGEWMEDRCGRKELVLARPSDEELALWLEKEITR